MTTALTRLAELYGIEPGYTDSFGVERHTSPETQRALLHAIGIPAQTESELAASLRLAEARDWVHHLPPVLVLVEGQPVELGVAIPAELSSGRIAWSVLDESGSIHQGQHTLDEVPALAECRIEGRNWRRVGLTLDVPLQLGYHHAEISLEDGTTARTRLIVAPERCFGPEDLAPGRRMWGFGAQLYGIRSRRNWGIGDFTDLGLLANAAARQGAAFIGVNPIHALFPADRHRFGPYAPSSRLFRSVTYIDIEAVPELADAPAAAAEIASPAFQARIEAARSAELVDYPAVSDLKLPLLRQLYAFFRKRHLGPTLTERGARFRAFQRWAGEQLTRHATFEALHERFFSSDPGLWSWRRWPNGFSDHASPEVAAYAQSERERVEFYEYLQWIADDQLAAAQAKAKQAGMAVGLYCDLAVGVDPGGALAWSNPGLVAVGASVGAPPDDFNHLGQNWGLSGFSPQGLVQEGYTPFIDSVRANMRHVGALRIDHVMALRRLYWIPEGGTGLDGAYISYPFQDLIRIVALESVRNRCIVIGEDLGTLPSGFRPALQQAGVLSYRVLYFEQRSDGSYSAPEELPDNALATVSTHDLPTLKGWWEDRDILWRDKIGLFGPGHRQEALDRRDRERRALLKALGAAGMLPNGIDPESPPAELPHDLLIAFHRFVASSPSKLMMTQLEDAIEESEQANLPGTTDEHPNWRRKLGLRLEDFFTDPRVIKLTEALTQARAD
jgi:4-alpha-glucanotransferase